VQLELARRREETASRASRCARQVSNILTIGFSLFFSRFFYWLTTFLRGISVDFHAVLWRRGAGAGAGAEAGNSRVYECLISKLTES
jgi:hypothetical protein